MAIKIFIDQGHNPQNPNAGAEANGLREQDINYNVGILLAEMLNNNPNFEARTSRTYPTEQLGTSTLTSLQTRVALANSWGLIISSASTPTPAISPPPAAAKPTSTGLIPKPQPWPPICWWV